MIKYYKIINNSNSNIIAVSKTGDYIPKVRYVAENDQVILCNPKTIKFAFGASINGNIYSLEKQFKDFPLCSFIEIEKSEYDYLKSIFDKEEEEKLKQMQSQEDSSNVEDIIATPTQVEDSYDNYKKSNDSDVMRFAKEMKIKEMKSKCKSAIVSGIDVELENSISSEHFDLTIEDQMNLNSLRYSMILNSQDQIAFHCKDGEFKYYSKQDILKIIEEMDKHILYHNSYFNALKNYINSLIDYNQVVGVEYGQDFPDTYKSEILRSFSIQL